MGKIRVPKSETTDQVRAQGRAAMALGEGLYDKPEFQHTPDDVRTQITALNSALTGRPRSYQVQVDSESE